MSKEKNKILFLFITLAIFIYISILKYPKINSIPFAYDEADYVSNSILLTKLKNQNDPIWQERVAYDQPHFYHYLCGIYLQHHFNKSIDDILKENMLDKTYKDGGIIKFTSVGGNKQLNSPEVKPFVKAYSLVLQSRKLSFYFYCLTGLILIIFLYFFSNNIPNYLLVILFLSNDFIFKNLIYAQADGLLIFSLSLIVLLNLLYIKFPKIQEYIILPIALISGLSLSTKINGLMSLIFSLITINLFLNKKQTNQKIIHSLLLLATTFFTFIILNPFLYNHTYDNIVSMLQYRINFYHFVSPDIFSKNLIIKYFQFSKLIYGYIGLTPTLSTIISSILTVAPIISSYFILNKKCVSNKTTFFLMFTSTIISILIIFYIPANWERYFIPAMLFNLFTLLSINNLLKLNIAKRINEAK